MASAIRKEVTLRGYRPSEFTLFAFGGGGPTHVAGYMGEIPRAVMFPFSPVFCAYGSSIMDVVHLYERSQRMMLLAPLTGAPAVDREAFNAMVRELMDEARREVEAEGLNWDDATVSLELDMLYGGQIHSKRASSPLLFLESEDDVRAVYERFEQEFSEAFSPLAVNVPGGVYIDTFVLRVAIPGQKLELPELELTDEAGRRPSARARRGSASGWTRRSTSSRRCSPGTRSPARRSCRRRTRPRSSHRAGGSRIESHGLGILEGLSMADPHRRPEAGHDPARRADRRRAARRRDAGARRLRDRLPAHQRHPRRGARGLPALLALLDGHRRRRDDRAVHAPTATSSTRPPARTCTRSSSRS